TDLNADTRLRRELDDDAPVGEHAVLRAVEIDDVQPGGSELAVSVQQVERLVFVAGFRVEIALEQAHAAPVPEVDGRDEQHQFNLRKFASMREPIVPERSG